MPCLHESDMFLVDDNSVELIWKSMNHLYGLWPLNYYRQVFVFCSYLCLVSSSQQMQNPIELYSPPNTPLQCLYQGWSEVTTLLIITPFKTLGCNSTRLFFINLNRISAGSCEQTFYFNLTFKTIGFNSNKLNENYKWVLTAAGKFFWSTLRECHCHIRTKHKTTLINEL